MRRRIHCCAAPMCPPLPPSPHHTQRGKSCLCPGSLWTTPTTKQHKYFNGFFFYGNFAKNASNSLDYTTVDILRKCWSRSREHHFSCWWGKNKGPRNVIVIKKILTPPAISIYQTLKLTLQNFNKMFPKFSSSITSSHINFQKS